MGAMAADNDNLLSPQDAKSSGSWLSRLLGRGNSAAPSPTHIDAVDTAQTDCEEIRGVPGGGIEFPLRTSDGRHWRVHVSPAALERLEEYTGIGFVSDIGLVLRNLHHLEVVALRAIARGNIADGTVEIDASSIRF